MQKKNNIQGIKRYSGSININKEMVWIILSLAWPTMLEQLMQTAVQYIDTAMVGSLGTQATAAVGATTTINWLLGSTLSALSVGFLAFVRFRPSFPHEGRQGPHQPWCWQPRHSASHRRRGRACECSPF